jgi:hypothetical protein
MIYYSWVNNKPHHEEFFSAMINSGISPRKSFMSIDLTKRINT